VIKDGPKETDRSEGAFGNGRLDSWKEIAAYLKRDVTTVRRWEKREGLPVHRHLHDTRDSVYAYTGELDGWWQGRGNHLSEPAASSGVSPSVEGERDRRAWLAWVAAALLAISTVSLAVVHFRQAIGKPRVDRRTVRLSVLPEEPTRDFALPRMGVSWRSSVARKTTRVCGFVRSIRLHRRR
jgi:hypothetical protein